MRYLAGTAHYALTYHKCKADEPVFAISDADHALRHSRTKYEIDPKSCNPRGGYAIMRGGAAVLWSSTHLKTCASSSTEAEYRTASDCVKRMIWAQELLRDTGFDTITPTKIQIDNQSAIKMGMSLTSISRTQHIRNDEMQFTEHIQSGHILPEYVTTADNTADLLTKGLNAVDTRRHAETLLGLSPNLDQYSKSVVLT
jgi:hypothetical protein